MADSEVPYDIETEPVVAWAILRDGEGVRAAPITAPVTDERRGTTPFDEVAVPIDREAEVIEVVPDTTDAFAKLVRLEDDRGEYLAELGYHYEGASNPDWQAVAAAVDEQER